MLDHGQVVRMTKASVDTQYVWVYVCLNTCELAHDLTHLYKNR